MPEFTPIETQEDFDARIADRLQRQENKIRSEYADYDTLKGQVQSLTNQVGTLQADKQSLGSQITELQNQVKVHETTSVKMRIALDEGLPYEFADRLTGEDEEAIRADAKNLAKYVGQGKQTPPAYTPEAFGGDKEAKRDKAFLDLARQIGKTI